MFFKKRYHEQCWVIQRPVNTFGAVVNILKNKKSLIDEMISVNYSFYQDEHGRSAEFEKLKSREDRTCFLNDNLQGSKLPWLRDIKSFDYFFVTKETRLWYQMSLIK